MSNKRLEELLEKGWKNTEIKYSDFRVYAKKNERILYNVKTDKIIIRYITKENRGIKNE